LRTTRGGAPHGCSLSFASILGELTAKQGVGCAHGLFEPTALTLLCFSHQRFSAVEHAATVGDMMLYATFLVVIAATLCDGQQVNTAAAETAAAAAQRQMVLPPKLL